MEAASNSKKRPLSRDENEGGEEEEDDNYDETEETVDNAANTPPQDTQTNGAVLRGR
jgi:hypothetical protein